MLGLMDIRKGKIIVLDGEPYIVNSAEFLRKQQRKPVVRSILKHLKTGAAREHSFQQSDKIPEADVERRQYQFLFGDDQNLTFMDNETYEQVEFKKEEADDSAKFLLEGQEAQILFFDGTPVTVELPIKITRTVIDAPPGIRGNTSTNVMKEVTIEGNVKTKAPLFVEEGDKIVIDTRNGAYVERA